MESLLVGMLVAEDYLGLERPAALVLGQALDLDRERCLSHDPTVA
jgi:hypothetical protein